MNIAGYAALWADRADDATTHRYILQPYCFTRLAKASVRLSWDDNARIRLAHSSDGSLELWNDDVGVAFRANVCAATLRAVGGERPGCSIVWRTLASTPLADGYLRVDAAALLECCLTHSPAFDSPGCWPLHQEPEDMPWRLRKLRASWEARRTILRPAPRPARASGSRARAAPGLITLPAMPPAVVRAQKIRASYAR